MGSPDPSFGSQWDPFEDGSQQADDLALGRLADWGLEYTIEWKVTVNNRAIMPKITEPELVLAPADYWERFLAPKLEDFLRKKNRSLRSESTTVVVSVTARSTPALTKLFDDTAIDWEIIERQLADWSELFRAGKKLRLSISFNYVDNPLSTTTSLQRTERRGRSSRTQLMLAERDEQLDAEEAASGQESLWASVYRYFRCPGHPCQLGPYCWIDPDGKKHYKLLRPDIESLVEYAQKGHIMKSHEHVPEDDRQKLYDREKGSLEAHKKATKATTSVGNLPIPITITVLSAPAGTPALGMPLTSTSPDRLDIPGPLEGQVKEYCTWHQSRVQTAAWKEDCTKACDVMIKHGIDLNQLRCDRDHQFLIDEGVLKGTAKRFVSEIDYWFVTTKRPRIEEELD